MTDTVAVPGFYGYTGAALHLHVDRTEHQRRQTVGLGAISSPDVIAVVMALPHAEPIPWQDLSRYQRHVVKRAPAGIFRITKTGRTPQPVTRLALRPCRIVRATVYAATASATALSKAASFAPMCERSLTVTHRPTMDETLIEFGFYGVGLYLDTGDGQLETLVEPQPWRPMRHTPAGWGFAEQAYRSFLTYAPAALTERITTP